MAPPCTAALHLPGIAAAARAVHQPHAEPARHRGKCCTAAAAMHGCVLSNVDDLSCCHLHVLRCCCCWGRWWQVGACSSHQRKRGSRLLQAIGYDMDYTLIHYDVEAWEGKAYAYGLQVRCCSLWPTASSGCAVMRPGRARACMNVRGAAAAPGGMLAGTRGRHKHTFRCSCRVQAAGVACAEAACSLHGLLLAAGDCSTHLPTLPCRACGRWGAPWRGCALTAPWSSGG